MVRPFHRCTDALRTAIIIAVVAVATILVPAARVSARPDQIVSVCGTDDAAGGLNLATALSKGGQIIIRCPPGQQEIRFTQTRDLMADITITADGPLTLRGPANNPMFTTTHALGLSKLTVTNPAGSIVSGDTADLSLTSVTVTGSRAAILARSVHAEDSHFTNNGDANADGSGSAVIAAETVQLVRSEFDGNGDHPIAGGAWPTPNHAPLSRRVVIEDTTFTHNRNTVLLIDAKVIIRSSKFTDNGQGPSTAHDAWGCCGGAITFVRSDAEILDSDFLNNRSTGFGGAMLSVGSRLTVRSSTFEGNEARVGGAVTSWARTPLVNIWSIDDWTDLPRLVMARVTFKDNTATADGGAVAFTGPAEGQGIVFTGNNAHSSGGAIASWNAVALPAPYDGVDAAMSSNTQPQLPDSLTLSRSILVENHAGDGGAALATADAETSVGNSIVVRNSAAGAAVTGTKLRLINTVVADNSAPGIQSGPGGTTTLGNTIVLRNKGTNCVAGTVPVVLGRNIQYPGNDCGGQIQTTNPGLDGTYAPGLVSAARDGGDYGLCLSEPTVAGVDLDGQARVTRHHQCAAGAIERDLLDSAASALSFGHTGKSRNYLLLLFIVLLLIAFLSGLIWRHKRHR